MRVLNKEQGVLPPLGRDQPIGAMPHSAKHPKHSVGWLRVSVVESRHRDDQESDSDESGLCSEPMHRVWSSCGGVASALLRLNGFRDAFQNTEVVVRKCTADFGGFGVEVSAP